MDYIGPFAIDTLLDRNHATLKTIEGKKVYGIFHIARLKIAWLRTDKGVVSDMSQLKGAENFKCTDETGQQLKNVPKQSVRFILSKGEPVEIHGYYKIAETNGNMAHKEELTDENIQQLLTSTMSHANIPKEVNFNKIRFKNGGLQLLLILPTHPESFWLDTSLHPHLSTWIEKLSHETTLRITGSKHKFDQQLFR